MNSIRRYTRETANEVLPEVRARVTALRDAFAEIAGHEAAIQHAVPHNGGGSTAPKWIEAAREMSRQLGWLGENGIEVRDIEQVLIDFPSEKDGEQILLCWKLGEDSVDFWHYPDAGFAGRQPL